MAFQVLILTIVKTALLITTVASVRCSTRHDCFDGSPDTVDICLPQSGRCINVYPSNVGDVSTVREQAAAKPTFTTKEDIISEANANPLSSADRRKILSTIASFAGEFNPHRFIHLNLLKFDPVQALNDLSIRLENEEVSNVEFHEEVRSIFQRMDDFHSIYNRSSPLRESAALLGFQMKRFYKSSGFNFSFSPPPSYVVTDIIRDEPFSYPDTSFVDGVEVLRWNGHSINEAVKLAGFASSASNSAAQVFTGTTYLSNRNLIFDAIPEEKSVDVTFRNLEGEVRTMTVQWIYLKASQPATASEDVSEASAPGKRSLNVRMEHPNIQTAGGLGYLPSKVSRINANRTEVPVHSNFTESIFAEIVQTASDPVGRMLIVDFPFPTPELIAEYKRLLSLMPETGLILDLRANLGGSPDTAKVLLELVSDIEVPPLLTSIRATEFMKKFIFADEADLADDEELRQAFATIYKPYRPALGTALSAGERFTGPVELSLTDIVPNRQIRIYNGPFIVVVDAGTYSSGDVFSAFVKDTGITELVGTDDATGAGGASTVKYEGDLRLIAPKLYDPLPGGVEFSTAFLRFFRTGNKSGSIVENFGIQPNLRYYLSKRDVLENDCDLFEFLAKRVVSRGDVESSPESEPEASPDIGL